MTGNAFSLAANSEARRTHTANGARAFCSSGNALLDLFSSIGAMRNADETMITTLLAEAWKQDPLLATRAVFYTRDIRGDRVGKGERQTFRILLNWLAKHHPEAVIDNIPLIGFYGRFDDLYTLIDTPLEDAMWSYMKEQLVSDLSGMHWNQTYPDQKKRPVSLLAKWMKSPRTSSEQSRALARKTWTALGFSSEKAYRKTLAEIRAYLPVLERQMSDGQWESIDYESVPSQAMKQYRTAFARHDPGGRFRTYQQAVSQGKAKVNASTLFPYELIAPYLQGFYPPASPEDPIIEAQWNALPDYIGRDVNTLVIADVSGSMYCSVAGASNLPVRAAVSLAIYFAQRNTGPFHNLFMTFSEDSDYVSLQGETLAQMVYNVQSAKWGWSTNLEGAFSRVLNTAIDNHIDQAELPRALIVISDMQIDRSTSHDWSFYSAMKAKFAAAGYEIPRVIFWNVNCTRPTMLVSDPVREGVLLISGMNAKTFAELIDNLSSSTLELMEASLNNPRYDAITIRKNRASI